ncbi:3603_t:CDS:2, partial [Gigaspora rosea]
SLFGGFGPCPNVEDTFSVTMSPDPLVSPHLITITIAGEEVDGLTIDAVSSLVITIGATVPVQTPSVFPVCNSTDCPIFTGKPYSQTVTFLLNAPLPPSYQIDLTIGNINSSSPDMSFLHDEILACFVGKKEESMNVVYPSNPACLYVMDASLEYYSRSDGIPSVF